MSQPTAVDLNAAYKYAAQRSKLLKLEYIYKNYPHIASKLKYEIYDADTNQDYYFRDSFANRAIMTNVIVTEDACDSLKCVPWKPSGPCKAEDEARLYRVGQTDNYEVACGPACYHLKDGITYNESGEPEVNIPNVAYNKFNDRCMFTTPAQTWMEFPLSRDTSRYAKRLNNFELGFDKVDDKNFLNGFKYKYNQYYCDQFETSLKDDNCVEPWWNILVKVTVGDALFKTMQASIRQITTGTSMKPSNLPDPPEIDPMYLVVNWKRDVRTNFTVPDPETEDRNALRPTFVTISKPKGGISSGKRRILDAKKSVTIRKPRKVRDSKSDLDTAKDQINIAMADIMGANLKTSTGTKIMEALKNMFLNEEFLLGLGVDYIIDSFIPRIMKTLTGRLSSMILKLTTRLGSSIGTSILRSATVATTARIVTSMAGKLVSKVVLALGRMAAMASSVVGIILIVSALMDILFAYFDPMGFNNQFPKGYLDDLQTAYDSALRQQTGLSQPELNFDVLTTYLLSENEILEISFEEFIWVFEYLDHLVVNSEGSRIDKGDELDLNEYDDETVNDMLDEMAANDLKIYTQNELKEFEENHFKRLKIVQSLNILGMLFIVIGTALMIVNPILSMLVILFAIFLFILSYICVQSDIVFELPIDGVYDKVSEWIENNKYLSQFSSFVL